MFFSKPLRLIKLARILLVLVLALFISFADIPPAQAEIRTFEESPGQVLTQSRTTLKDEFGTRWQAIAFKRTKPDGSEIVALRLVGFPGAVTIDRSRPLMLKDYLGNTRPLRMRLSLSSQIPTIRNLTSVSTTCSQFWAT